MLYHLPSNEMSLVNLREHVPTLVINAPKSIMRNNIQLQKVAERASDHESIQNNCGFVHKKKEEIWENTAWIIYWSKMCAFLLRLENFQEHISKRRRKGPHSFVDMISSFWYV